MLKNLFMSHFTFCISKCRIDSRFWSIKAYSVQSRANKSDKLRYYLFHIGYLNDYNAGVPAGNFSRKLHGISTIRATKWLDTH